MKNLFTGAVSSSTSSKDKEVSGGVVPSAAVAAGSSAGGSDPAGRSAAASGGPSSSAGATSGIPVKANHAIFANATRAGAAMNPPLGGGGASSKASEGSTSKDRAPPAAEATAVTSSAFSGSTPSANNLAAGSTKDKGEPAASVGAVLAKPRDDDTALKHQAASEKKTAQPNPSSSPAPTSSSAERSKDTEENDDELMSNLSDDDWLGALERQTSTETKQSQAARQDIDSLYEKVRRRSFGASSSLAPEDSVGTPTVRRASLTFSEGFRSRRLSAGSGLASEELCGIPTTSSTTSGFMAQLAANYPSQFGRRGSVERSIPLQKVIEDRVLPPVPGAAKSSASFVGGTTSGPKPESSKDVSGGSGAPSSTTSGTSSMTPTKPRAPSGDANSSPASRSPRSTKIGVNRAATTSFTLAAAAGKGTEVGKTVTEPGATGRARAGDSAEPHQNREQPSPPTGAPRPGPARRSLTFANDSSDAKSIAALDDKYALAETRSPVDFGPANKASSSSTASSGTSAAVASEARNRLHQQPGGGSSATTSRSGEREKTSAAASPNRAARVDHAERTSSAADPTRNKNERGLVQPAAHSVTASSSLGSEDAAETDVPHPGGADTSMPLNPLDALHSVRAPMLLIERDLEEDVLAERHHDADHEARVSFHEQHQATMLRQMREEQEELVQLEQLRQQSKDSNLSGTPANLLPAAMLASSAALGPLCGDADHFYGRSDTIGNQGETSSKKKATSSTTANNRRASAGSNATRDPASRVAVEQVASQPQSMSSEKQAKVQLWQLISGVLVPSFDQPLNRQNAFVVSQWFRKLQRSSTNSGTAGTAAGGVSASSGAANASSSIGGAPGASAYRWGEFISYVKQAQKNALLALLKVQLKKFYPDCPHVSEEPTHLEKIFEILWPTEAVKQLAQIRQWILSFDLQEHNKRIKVKPPPLLPSEKCEELEAMYAFLLKNKTGDEDLQFGDVLEAKLLSDEEAQQWSQKFQKTSGLSQEQFMEVACPNGFRASETVTRCVAADGKELTLDPELGWILQDNK
ncbi:unnamed protein product [Amoebophrya sp. A120]|nr:unnamed protein product [Amoebophrya sp. A120]|eukprot:GSA120T00020166001.1